MYACHNAFRCIRTLYYFSTRVLPVFSLLTRVDIRDRATPICRDIAHNRRRALVAATHARDRHEGTMEPRFHGSRAMVTEARQARELPSRAVTLDKRASDTG